MLASLFSWDYRMLSLRSPQSSCSSGDSGWHCRQNGCKTWCLSGTCLREGSSQSGWSRHCHWKHAFTAGYSCLPCVSASLSHHSALICWKPYRLVFWNDLNLASNHDLLDWSIRYFDNFEMKPYLLGAVNSRHTIQQSYDMTIVHSTYWFNSSSSAFRSDTQASNSIQLNIESRPEFIQTSGLHRSRSLLNYCLLLYCKLS